LRKSAEKLRRIGLLANFDKPSSRTVVREAAQLITDAGRTVAADVETAREAELPCETFADPAALAQKSDLLLVFG
jgi:hypothetical protein